MLEKYINHENKNSSFSKNDFIFLFVLIAVGSIVRFYYHYNRPFSGDEVGTLIYMKESVAFILSHFESWLTMNYFILLEKVLLRAAGGDQIILGVVPEVAGIATIFFTAILAKMFTSKKVALISAALVAFNPYMISFSGVIRAYSLLAALSLLAVILFFRWYQDRTFKNGIYAALACYLLMLSHLNGVYTLAYLFFLIGLELLYALSRKNWANLPTILIPLSISLLMSVISYIRIASAVIAWGIPWHDVPPTSIAYIPYAFSSYFGNGFYGWASAILMLFAILLTFKLQKPSIILTPLIVLPSLLISIQGISHYPWAYARFLIFLVPICIIFITEGMEYLALAFSMKNSFIFSTIGILVIITWLPNFTEGYNVKISQPWQDSAVYIQKTTPDGTLIYNSWLDSVDLLPYFANTPYPQYELASYAKEDIPATPGKNVYFVITGAKISSNYPVSDFGDIQVIIYPKTTYTEQLTLIRDDLQKSVMDQKVSPELSDAYHSLWVLDTRLNGYTAQNFKYYDLYIQCFQLTNKQKYLPLSTQYSTLKSSGYNVK